MKISLRNNNLYYVAFFIFSCAYTIFLDSTINGFLGLTNSQAYYIFYDLAILLVIFNAFYKKRYTRREAGVFIVLLALTVITQRMSGSDFLVPLFIFTIGAKGIDKNRLINTVYYSQLISVGLIIILALLGIIDNHSHTYNYDYLNISVVRSGLGFKHANVFGGRILQIALCYVYRRLKNWKVKDYVVIVVLAVFVNAISYSRTSVVLLLLLDLFVLLIKVVKNARISDRILAILCYSPLICAVFSIVISLYFTNSALFGLLDQYFTARLSAINQFIGQYGFSLLGQEIQLVSSSTGTVTGQMFAILDNSYAHLAIRLGVVSLIIIVFGIQQTAKKALVAKEYEILILIAVCAFWGITETAFFRLPYNFVLLLMYGELYHTSKEVSNG